MNRNQNLTVQDLDLRNPSSPHDNTPPCRPPLTKHLNYGFIRVKQQFTLNYLSRQGAGISFCFTRVDPVFYLDYKNRLNKLQ